MLPHFETFTWQNLTPAEKVPELADSATRLGGSLHLQYHVNVINLNGEIIWTGRLPHISGLPHLPGVLHLHVNRPLARDQRDKDVLQTSLPILHTDDLKRPNFKFS